MSKYEDVISGMIYKRVMARMAGKHELSAVEAQYLISMVVAENETGVKEFTAKQLQVINELTWLSIVNRLVDSGFLIKRIFKNHAYVSLTNKSRLFFRNFVRAFRKRYNEEVTKIHSIKDLI